MPSFFPKCTRCTFKNGGKIPEKVLALLYYFTSSRHARGKKAARHTEGTEKVQRKAGLF